MKGINPSIVTDSLAEYAAKIKKFGVEAVAKKAGVKPAIVKRFINDVMASKNSDIKKIKDAVNSLDAPPAEPTPAE